MRIIEQAVILVGGRGVRLRPLTAKVPKPMVLAAGKPFLEHLILLLKRNGIKRYLLLAGFLGRCIEEYFGNGHKWGVDIAYSFESSPIGTGGALRLGRDKLEEDFFLLFGDSYLPIDYKKMANDFIESKKVASLSVYDNSEDTEVPFNVRLGKNKRIVTVYNKRKDNPASFNYCDAGVIAVDKVVIDLINKEVPNSFEESIYPRLIAEEGLGCHIAENRFYDIGTIERLKTFEQYIVEKEKR